MNIITTQVNNSKASITRHYIVVGETQEHFEQHRRYMVVSDKRNVLNKNNRYIVSDTPVPDTLAYKRYKKALAMLLRINDKLAQARSYEEYTLRNVIYHDGWTDTVTADHGLVSEDIDAIARLKRAKRQAQRKALRSGSVIAQLHAYHGTTSALLNGGIKMNKGWWQE